VLASDEPDADVAMLTAQLGHLHYFAGNLDTARERIELALETAEELDLPGVLAGALNTKSLVLQNRPHESHALLREALAIALSYDLVFDALRAYNNLIVRMVFADRRRTRPAHRGGTPARTASRRPILEVRLLGIDRRSPERR
jgi:hypothetical protein